MDVRADRAPSDAREDDRTHEVLGRAHDHGVLFYESDDELAGVVARFALEGLSREERVVLIVTPERGACVLRHLEDAGVACARVVELGQLAIFDARATLQRIVRGGILDEDAFARVRDELVPAGTAAFRAYGEMVDLLWRDGLRDAALRLEAMWTTMQSARAFPVLCSYLARPGELAAEDVHAICHAHTHVVAAVERPPRLSILNPDASSARKLVDEISRRVDVERELRALVAEQDRARHRAELLYGLARAVIAARNVDEVFHVALDGMEDALGTARSSILTFDEHAVMRFRAWRGLSDEYRASVEGHSPWPADALAPNPVIVTDVRADAAWASYLDVFARADIRALAFIPLVAGGELVGKLMVYDDQPHAFSAQELDVASAIANHIAAAVLRFRAVAELEQTVRFNQMFTGILGHDLRNPLGAIMTAAQLIERRSDNERYSRPAMRIVSSAHRMARMIDQLLDFTRVRVGEGIPLVAKHVDVAGLVREVVDELDDSHPGWTLDVTAAGSCLGTFDPDRLAQVFSNLVANAIEHGEAAHGVRVHLDGTGGAVVVEVWNQGAVPEALLGRLFEPMTGGARRRDGSRGLGLGLYISQEIVRAHGGRIAVRSSATEGTTFIVTLPRVAS